MRYGPRQRLWGAYLEPFGFRICRTDQFSDCADRPELLITECTNIICKKTRKGEISPAEADVACGILVMSGIDLRSMRSLMRTALRLATALDHPVYDCAYIALAFQEQSVIVTADRVLVRKVLQAQGLDLPNIVHLDTADALRTN